MSKAEKYFQESKDMSVKDAFEAGAYYTPYDMTSFAEQYHKTQTLKEHSDNLTLLKNYSEFLEKWGYLDTDWRYEKPYAINEYLKQLLNK